MQFLQPELLVLAVAALLPWVGPLRTRDRTHGVLRSLALLLVVGALARPVSRVEDATAHRVLLVDRSPSVTPSADDAARELMTAAVEAVGEGEVLSIVEIGGDGRAPLGPFPGVKASRVTGGQDSPLGRGLEAALRRVPAAAASGAITVITDGLATDDGAGVHWARAVADAAERGVTVDLRLVDPPADDLRPVSLEPVGGVPRVGEEAELRLTLVGGGQVVRCTLVGPNGELDAVEPVAVDGRAEVRFTFEPEAPGFLDLAAEVTVVDGVDPRGGDLRLARTLCVQDPTRLLYLGDRVRGGAGALAELLGPAFSVEEGDAAPTDEALDRADVVVLDDR
ncbi:MAG: hypothetical protein PVJ89_08935, partial [Planctomycetota bacterium]